MGDHALLARFEPDGAVGTGFGAAGMVVGPSGYATDVDLRSDGRIVVGVHHDAVRFVLARYLADGAD